MSSDMIQVDGARERRQGIPEKELISLSPCAEQPESEVRQKATSVDTNKNTLMSYRRLKWNISW